MPFLPSVGDKLTADSTATGPGKLGGFAEWPVNRSIDRKSSRRGPLILTNHKRWRRSIGLLSAQSPAEILNAIPGCRGDGSSSHWSRDGSSNVGQNNDEVPETGAPLRTPYVPTYERPARVKDSQFVSKQARK